MALGVDHSCARKSDGTAWCWGLNDTRQLGDNTIIQRTTPVQVTTLTGATTIGLGGDQACAVTGTGTLKCWGENNDGEVGDNSTTHRGIPVNVVGLTCP